MGTVYYLDDYRPRREMFVQQPVHSTVAECIYSPQQGKYMVALVCAVLFVFLISAR